MARTIGIVGGGQLARMMAQASVGLGVSVRLLSEASGSSAAQVVHDVTVGDYTDPATLAAFAEGCDVVTFDHEHVPTGLLRELIAAGRTVSPGPDALEYAQDKALMRDRLSGLGVPCPVYEIVPDAAALARFGDRIGWPVVAKTSRGGYDGKGVFVIDGPDDAVVPFDQMRTISAGEVVRIVAEEFVDFERELSVIVVRNPSGEARAYPVTETVQRDGVCVETTTPAPGLPEDRADALQAMALRIADELDVVGLLAVELMAARDGRVLVNELAMRPHNTGHWTIDGAATSQFENHLRAVLDWPVGSTDLVAPAVGMANVLGGSVLDLVAALPDTFAADPELRAHLYGKPVSPGRKVGHVTTLDSTPGAAIARARAAANHLMGVAHD